MKLALAICSLSLVGVAFAQPKQADPKAGAPATPPAKADPKAGAPVAPPVKAEPPAMPKPPAEIAAMVKTLGASWRCTGTGMGPDGQMGPMKSTVKTKSDLDGWWIVDTFEGAMGKSKFKMVAYTTYDAGSKKWRRMFMDNMGGQMIGTSDGLKDNKIDFNLDSMGPMGSGQFRDHVDLTDPKNVKMWGEMSADKGKNWMKVYEMTCKK